MKKNNSFLYLILLCILLACFGGCAGDPPVKNERVTDPAAYGQYNEYVQEDLDNTVSILPAAIPSDATVAAYKYSYDCAVLGDPNYSIILTLSFPNEAAYSREKNRIMELVDNETTTIHGDHTEQVYWGNTQEGLERLTDSEVLDGLSVRLAYIIFDADSRQILYAVGRLWDGSEHDPEILETGLMLRSAAPDLRR